MYLYKPFLLKFIFLSKFSSNSALAFLILSVHICAMSLYFFPGYMFLVPLPMKFFLTCYFDQETLLRHAGLLPSFPDLLNLGTENSCALRKLPLKSCQLCSTSLSVRAISQSVLSTNSLNNLKFILIKFRVLNLLFIWPIQDYEFHQSMTTASQAATNLNLARFIGVGKQQVH